MDNSFTEQFSSHIKFSYSCFDRIIFRGYINCLFSTDNVISLLRNLGFYKHSNEVIKLLSSQLSEHISKTAEMLNIPLLWRDNIGGKEVKMQDYVEQNYLKRNKFGVICIIKTMENVQTLWNKEIRTKSGKTFVKMYWCKKPVSQYYIYINDAELGLCYLKLSSYLPYYCEFYCNGHYYLARQFDKKGISYKMSDNSFVEVGDLDYLEKMVSEFNGKIVEQRLKMYWDKWFRFSKGERSTRSALLKHKWYTCQAEISSNVVFKQKAYFERVYDKLLEKHHRIGIPDKMREVFELKRTPKESKTVQSLFGTQACIKHWFKGNSIKMYNKGGCLLRVETTINNPRLPGAELHKPICYLQGYYWYGHRCNDRFLETLSDVDTSQLNANQAFYNQAVVSEKGKRIAAPDLRQDKQLALVALLLSSRFSAEWFRTKELSCLLSGHFSKTAEIRYQMEKLLQRGLIEKRQNANYYRVTKEGYVWLYVSYFQNRYFVNPLLSKMYKNDLSGKTELFDELETAINSIYGGLNTIYQQLNIAS